jgi:hypothetical protein
MNIKILIFLFITSFFLLTTVLVGRSGGVSGSRSFSSRSSSNRSSSSSSYRRSSNRSSTGSTYSGGESGSSFDIMRGMGISVFILLIIVFLIFVPNKIISRIKIINGLEIKFALNIPYGKFEKNINEHFREKYAKLYDGKVPNHLKYDEKKFDSKFYEYIDLNKENIKYASIQELPIIKYSEMSYYNKITQNILNEISEIEKNTDNNKDGYFIITIIIAYQKEKLNLDIDNSSKDELLSLIKNFFYGENKHKDIRYRFTNIAFKEKSLTKGKLKTYYSNLEELV